jgi:uncharacterized alpha-E superfamily protein
MSRYTERAENVARFIDVTLNLTIDMGQERQLQWEPLIYTTGDQELFFERYSAANQENVIRFLTFDDENPNSIISWFEMPGMIRELFRPLSNFLEESNRPDTCSRV